MGRSAKDTRETVAMLDRVSRLGISRDDAEALRRISMTLHRWHEAECGNGNDVSSWSIARGHKSPRIFSRDPVTQAPIWTGGEFTYDENGATYMERSNHKDGKTIYYRIPDRENGARKRLAAIMARYPGLTAYVQTDPRGCALYIIEAARLPAGASVNSCYSSVGVAVFA